MNQQQLTDRNRVAWDANSYDAWVNRYGEPVVASASIVADPKHALRRILKYVGNPASLKIANPLGSHGRIATALSLMEAEVTVFDVSNSNAKYALELADTAGVSIEYIVGDFQKKALDYQHKFDVIVMELGVIHYFVDASAFVASLRMLLKQGGKIVFNEFHPLVKKSVDISSAKPVFYGDYFTTDCEEAETPYKIFTENEVPACLIRRWNLGEIVTAFASGQFVINRLDEHASSEFPKLPGTFTLVATAA